jgi:hypothetical protein
MRRCGYLMRIYGIFDKEIRRFEEEMRSSYKEIRIF